MYLLCSYIRPVAFNSIDGPHDVTGYYCSISVPLKNIFWSAIRTHHPLLRFRFARTLSAGACGDGHQIGI